MTAFLIDPVAKGGLGAILLTMAGESAGLPISSEILVPLGGSLAASDILPFAGVVAAATAGNLRGSASAFALARRYGAALVIRHGRRCGIDRGSKRGRPSTRKNYPEVIELAAQGWTRRQIAEHLPARVAGKAHLEHHAPAVLVPRPVGGPVGDR